MAAYTNSTDFYGQVRIEKRLASLEKRINTPLVRIEAVTGLESGDLVSLSNTGTVETAIGGTIGQVVPSQYHHDQLTLGPSKFDRIEDRLAALETQLSEALENLRGKQAEPETVEQAVVTEVLPVLREQKEAGNLKEALAVVGKVAGKELLAQILKRLGAADLLIGSLRMLWKMFF